MWCAGPCWSGSARFRELSNLVFVFGSSFGASSLIKTDGVIAELKYGSRVLKKQDLKFIIKAKTNILNIFKIYI